MKKIMMLLVMLLALAFSSVCSASNGSLLDAEEAAADKFLNGGSYKAVSALLTADMQKNWDEKAYGNFKKQLAKDFGSFTSHRLLIVEKHPGADVLLYQAASEKIPAARFIYIFKLNGEKPLLDDFKVMLPQKQEEASAAK